MQRSVKQRRPLHLFHRFPVLKIVAVLKAQLRISAVVLNPWGSQSSNRRYEIAATVVLKPEGVQRSERRSKIDTFVKVGEATEN
ncbi:unnamed protein product [Linum trigynum]|uniref:Uncharacterized protein n=1 Tax=Linum trigynum TaxID=586398 RepID=A0AAV2G1W4_9ROSI